MNKFSVMKMIYKCIKMWKRIIIEEELILLIYANFNMSGYISFQVLPDNISSFVSPNMRIFGVFI